MHTTPLLAAVSARPGHFLLESGHHADLWLDLETLCVKPGRVQQFAAALAERLRRYEVDAVCGPLNEGAFVALMVASALECRFTYAERFAPDQAGGLFRVAYRVPKALHATLQGKRVAIVNDVISAGSAVRGTLADLETIGAEVVAIGALLVLGDTFTTFAFERNLTVEALTELPFNIWAPAECPLCRSGTPLGT